MTFAYSRDALVFSSINRGNAYLYEVPEDKHYTALVLLSAFEKVLNFG